MTAWQRWVLQRILDTYGAEIIDKLVSEVKSEIREFTQETETDLDDRVVRMFERALK